MKSALRIFVLIAIFWATVTTSARATHIVGGEINYRYLGNNIYRISITVYRDCYNGVPPFDDPLSLGIFNAITNTLVREKQFSFIDLDTVPPTINAPCFIPPTNICYERTVYSDTLFLPPSSGGYILAYQRCCRNMTILNIVTPDAVGATYEAWIAGSSVYSQNSNPVFNLWPPPFVCAGYPFTFDHSASDLEGDSIVYELVTPFDGGTQNNPMPQPPLSPPYTPVTFTPSYSQQNMLGCTPPLSIDSQSGLLTCTPSTLGQFVIGVRAKEYRGGILVGYTRRDFQLNVVPCPSLVVAALQNPIINCGSNTIGFQNFSFNAGAYHWDFGVPSLSNDTSNLFSPNFTYPDTGVYTVTLIAISNQDPTCTDTTTGTVTVLPDFRPGFYYALDTCSNTVQFTDTFQISGGSTISRKWQFGDGNTSILNNPSHTYNTAGIFNVTLIAISDRGCIDTIRKSILIPPLLQSTQQQVSAVSCNGDCDGNAMVTGLYGLSPYQYQWNDPQNQTGSFAQNLCPGTYIVTVRDSRNCTTSDTVSIAEPLPLNVQLSATSDYCGGICAGSATASPTGGNGGFSYSWNDPQQQTGPMAQNLCPGWYAIEITDQNGCTISDSIQIIYVDSFPLVTAEADTQILYLGQSTVLHAITTSSNYNFIWSPAGSLSSSTDPDPIANPNTDTQYILIATDQNGCTATDTVNIRVIEVLCDEPEIFIPNAFSPNGDNSNDVFYVRGNTLEKIELSIFDRWGEKVFESDNQSNGWNGSFKGAIVPADVYVYYIEGTCYNRATFRKKGNITVIR